MILTFILWLIHFFELLREKYPSIPASELIFFLKALNLVAMTTILLSYVLKSDSSVLISYRLLWEFLFYGWILYFIKKVMPWTEKVCRENNKKAHMVIVAIKNCIMLIAMAGIVLELLGYGSLAIYWYTSWGKTMIVLMWSGLIIGASREWIPGSLPVWSGESQENSSQGNVQGQSPLQDDGKSQGYSESSRKVARSAKTQQLQPVGEVSILWLIKQLSFVLLFFLASIALFLSWGSSDYLFPRLVMMLTYSFNIGSMSFSLSSLAQAITILILTHYLARVWRHFFHTNFLGESGLDRGIQESMTTITVYSIWIFGIFIAMLVFGLNTTTLTVAFGALGIGIGFGLQNIFNNFISGIILLFERPIQVGDDIEINGTWATIRKTNVRSTVVQTYDNATIMIPNSELISNQVINWSFKDKRLRRKITVGVEYGSDIELVRETLLEIAQKTPKVLSYPAPDVLFEDFGDSALIFTLRFWTFIDFFIAVETDMRFQIDKLFRERKLVIAFPQQDIYIKSLPLTGNDTKS
ncbi:MscS Mechanosensitive ion channel (fragment) [Desulfamplus magnetovallimortis]|uniref:MscS Mechanosensitive ion channel n=1 Tax=Desulfamplus magnetovallimortis TaxID=1246637 RepID=A0A1W1HIF3_9BACT